MAKTIKDKFIKQLDDLSVQELKELVLVNSYKIALLRSQVEAISEILIKNNMATYEEIWTKTQKEIKESLPR